MAEPQLVDKKATFASFADVLDARILRALADMGFARPTLVQAKAIPLALESRDILARARTGSGKTAAYCIPVAQKILSAKSAPDAASATRALILVPTRELAEQVSAYLKRLLVYCEEEMSVSNVASGTTTHLQRTLLSDRPDIVIATPSRALALMQSKALIVSSLESLVIDEADLILSYGHDEDVRQIFSGAFLPKVYQSFLMSATMTEDVEMLKGLTLRNPAILRLEEDEDEAANLTQYSVRCTEVDKFLLTYVILKLKLIKGKCILFVNDVDRSYRLKLFLEQFSIKSCVLNSELPLNSRYHAVQEFNKGVYDYIIATDESGGGELDSEGEDEEENDDEEQEDEFVPSQREPTSPPPSSKKRKRAASPTRAAPATKKHKGKRKKNDAEYGVTRGHRMKGEAVADPEAEERVFGRIEKEQGARGSKVQEYHFDMKQVEAFRYRMEDALRSVTRSAVREARVTQLKAEILASDKLKAHFEDNPLDLEFLKHDKALHPARVQPHMKHVPKYLLPRIAPVAGEEREEKVGGKNGFVPFRKDSMSRGRGRGRGRGGSAGGGRGRKKSDPLKKFR
uniref:RNA helicase n=1 Tax=Mycena chlorophos TaxID=658473 RepID=A0ABQ0M8B8_MYCCL|nr:predicted protein [Mycena chlorophos]